MKPTHQNAWINTVARGDLFEIKTLLNELEGKINIQEIVLLGIYYSVTEKHYHVTDFIFDLIKERKIRHQEASTTALSYLFNGHNLEGARVLINGTHTQHSVPVHENNHFVFLNACDYPVKSHFDLICSYYTDQNFLNLLSKLDNENIHACFDFLPEKHKNMVADFWPKKSSVWKKKGFLKIFMDHRDLKKATDHIIENKAALLTSKKISKL